MIRRLFNEHRHHLREVVFFALVGLTATFTHYGIAVAINEWVLANVYVANLAGYSTAVLVSYFGHSILSFQVSFSRERFIKFCIASISTFLLSQVWLWVLQQIFPGYPKVTLFIVVISIPAISYLINKLWVFR